MMKLVPLPSLDDNYIWLLHNDTHALVVDPGDAAVVQAALSRLKLQLHTIFITHHHHDHTDGVDALRDSTGATVYGPALEDIPEPVTRLNHNDVYKFDGLNFIVIAVPGHTAGHIAYYCPSVQLDHAATSATTPNPSVQALLFCGDTLFSAGCGRLFEGTPAQMLASLDKLSALPGDTLVCCTHEYTLSNLKFAHAVDPTNTALASYTQRCQALRQQNLPTLPSTIAQEQAINPFLRSRQASVRETLASHAQQTITDDVQAFALLRAWKNDYR